MNTSQRTKTLENKRNKKQHNTSQKKNVFRPLALMRYAPLGIVVVIDMPGKYNSLL